MLSNSEYQATERVLDLIAQRSAESVWYAVQVKVRWEKAVSEALREKNYDEFLPLFYKQHQWSDRVKKVELPLFPGYVFCRADLAGRPPLVTTPGVIGLLRFGKALATISEEEIASLKRVIEARAGLMPWPYLNHGERVRITQGPLNGIEGLFVQTKRDSRIVLSVNALCRSVAVEVDREWIEPVTSSRSAA